MGLSKLRARRDVLRELDRLDPETDYHRMTQIVLGRIFCDGFFHQALFTVAYWRQTSVETIAPVLARRGYGNTLTETRKRNDDSLLFFGLIYRDGPCSAEGKRTIGRLAEIHKTFEIPMDDYRYTIASLCFEPMRLPAILGVKRGLTEREARALFLFWRGVGREWGVDIPEEQQEFRAWFHDYEQRTYVRSDDGVAIARAMEKAWLDRWAPGVLRPIGAQVLRAMGDDHLLNAVDMRPAHPLMKGLTSLAVKAYLSGRRLIPGPVRDDMLMTPWAAEYGGIPDSSVVGPRWARDIQVPEDKETAGCPF
ncbi:MAG TPA: oxygenase MpaB family protein [Sporichthyaceae bacterium]